jgi:hypothetical protein
MRMTSSLEEPGIRIHRLLDRPIIAANLHPTIGVNIQGPSMIWVPDWSRNRLGDYYLYFADHKGSYIRLAYADHPAGPWTIHAPGSLHLAQSRFLTEPPAASPQQVAQFEARLKSGARQYRTTPCRRSRHRISPRRMCMSMPSADGS